MFLPVDWKGLLGPKVGSLSTVNDICKQSPEISAHEQKMEANWNLEDMYKEVEAN